MPATPPLSDSCVHAVAGERAKTLLAWVESLVILYQLAAVASGIHNQRPHKGRAIAATNF